MLKKLYSSDQPAEPKNGRTICEECAKTSDELPGVFKSALGGYMMERHGDGRTNCFIKLPGRIHQLWQQTD